MLDLDQSDLGLWFAAAASTTAAVLTIAGAMAGIIRHRVPRMLLGVATTFVAASYWLDLAGWPDTAGDMRRGAAFLLWPSLAWTAYSGITYSRAIVAKTEEALEETHAVLRDLRDNAPP